MKKTLFMLMAAMTFVACGSASTESPIDSAEETSTEAAVETEMVGDSILTEEAFETLSDSIE